MCEAVGRKVLALHRSKIGNIGVKDLELGKWRYLTNKEVDVVFCETFEVDKLFNEKLKTAKPIVKTISSLSNLHTFTLYYFEKFRLPKVATRTYEADMHRYKKYIQPAFGDRQLQSITPEHCQNLIDTILAEGKGKTAEEIHSLLSIIFKGAIAHGLMDKNPLNLVVRMKHEGKHGGRHWRYFYDLYKQGKLEAEYERVIGLNSYDKLCRDGYIKPCAPLEQIQQDLSPCD